MAWVGILHNHQVYDT